MITALSLLTILIAGMFVLTMFAAIAASGDNEGHWVGMHGKKNATMFRISTFDGYCR